MRELLQLACFWGIVLCGALSLWPFRLARRWWSWSLYLPVVGILLYGIFERSLLAEADVRIKMMVLLPLLLFLVLNSMAKVVILGVLLPRSGGSRRRLRSLPQRRLQLALALPILAGCALWFWTMWN
jgi:hypothetical protein